MKERYNKFFYNERGIKKLTDTIDKNPSDIPQEIKVESKIEPEKELKKEEIVVEPIAPLIPVNSPIVIGTDKIENCIKMLSDKISFLEEDIQQIIQIIPDLMNTVIKIQNQPIIEKPIIESPKGVRRKIIINRDGEGKIISADLEEV